MSFSLEHKGVPTLPLSLTTGSTGRTVLSGSGSGTAAIAQTTQNSRLHCYRISMHRNTYIISEMGSGVVTRTSYGQVCMFLLMLLAHPECLNSVGT